ncbi:MAG: NAD-dependent epimerase/dehydratase family protein [Acidiferrobacterales bacterium]
MAKVLVTGASGFTGKALCQRLTNDGEHVVAFVRSTSKTDELETMGVECRRIDIKNSAEVRDNFPDVTQIYHVAAAYRAEHADHEEFRRVNVEATRHLLDAAQLHRVTRFVHCSTVGVQGEIEDPPANEEYRYKPADHYQESKLEGELLARRYFKVGLPGSVVRPVGIYGPGDTRFLKLFRAINSGYFVMIGSGGTLYHLTYIDDLIEGIILAGRRPEALGQVFTIAGKRYTTIRELVNLIADVLDKPHPKWRIPFAPVYAAAVVCDKVCRPLGMTPPIYPRRVEFFHRDRAFTIAKAKKLLGFEPKVELRDGLERTASWYQMHGSI